MHLSKCWFIISFNCLECSLSWERRLCDTVYLRLFFFFCSFSFQLYILWLWSFSMILIWWKPARVSNLVRQSEKNRSTMSNYYNFIFMTNDRTQKIYTMNKTISDVYTYTHTDNFLFVDIVIVAVVYFVLRVCVVFSSFFSLYIILAGVLFVNAAHTFFFIVNSKIFTK